MTASIANGQDGVFRGLPELDLRPSITNRNLDHLMLDRVLDITGWAKLLELKALSQITMVQCSSKEPAPPEKIDLTKMSLMALSTACLKTVLTFTRAEIITIRHEETPVLDMALLRNHVKLRHLFVYTGLAIGFRHLQGFPLERAHITNVNLDAEFLTTLRTWSGSLRELWLDNEQPFTPAELPDLPILETLKIPGYPEHLDAWRAWRAAHPKVALKFQRLPESSSKIPIATTVEIHHGIALVKVARGKKITYEAWGDFRGNPSHGGDNHDLRARLELSAAKAKKKIKVFSEADELGISSPKLEDVKWCLDALTENPGNGRALPGS